MQLHVIQGDEGDQFGDQVTQLYRIGQKMVLPDGRVFRYASVAGAAGVANKLYQSSAAVAHWNTQAPTVAVAIGDNNSQITDGGTAYTDADEGSIVYEDVADGLGQIFFVEHAQPTTGTNTPVFFKPGVIAQVAVALAAADVSTFIKNPWQDIIITPGTALTAIPCGVPPSIIAQDDWGWCQTMGVCSCLLEGTPIIGECVRASEGTGGAVTVQDYTEANHADAGTVGRMIEVAPNGDFGLIYLRME